MAAEGAGHAASYAEECAVLERAVREAGAVALNHFGTGVRQWTKGDASPVSEADLAVDAALRTSLSETRPEHGWISEETPPQRSTSGRSYVVDPIDGTRAFLDGQSSWAVSVALIEGGRPVAAALYRAPRDEMFLATRGGGSFRDGERLRLAERPLAGATVAARRAVFDGANMAEAGLIRGKYVPSLALRLAYITTGRFDGAVTRTGAHHWDLAAADLVLSEAGGVLTTLDGERLDYADPVMRHGPLAAGSPAMAAALARIAAGYEQQDADR